MPNLLSNIHYLWVGPPTHDNFFSIPGHDIAGPISMSKEIQSERYTEKNIIKFWCLKSHCEYYQQTFKKHDAIIDVCAIETLLPEAQNERTPATTLRSQLDQIIQNKAIAIDVIIEFKDRFSLFLLLNQPGYFFDTNVFPSKQGVRLRLPQLSEFTTAQSGLTGLHDFYLMYSPPTRSHKLYCAFERRLENRYYESTQVFEGLFIPRIDHEALGVQKISYKSYIQSQTPGFYRMLAFQNFDHFKEHCQYADINRQETCLFSKRLLEDYSLCWMSKKLSIEEIKALPIPTDFAYIASFTSVYSFLGPVVLIEPCVYFYSKKDNMAILLSNDDEEDVSAIYRNVFQINYYNDNKLQIRKGSTEHIDFIMKFFSKKHPDIHPPMLINTEGGTLLHHAILCDNVQKVEWLISLGAQLNLKASYHIKSFNSDARFEYTPLELAVELKLDNIIELLQPRTYKSRHLTLGTLKSYN